MFREQLRLENSYVWRIAIFKKQLYLKNSYI